MKLNSNKINYGDKIFEAEMNKNSYKNKLIVTYSLLLILLFGSLLFLNIVSESWWVLTISILGFLGCVFSCIYNIKYSIKNIRMRIYQNYIVLGNHSYKEILNISDLSEYIIYEPIIDKIFKTKNVAISFYFNNYNYKRRFVFNVKTPFEVIDEKINFAKMNCKEKSFFEVLKEQKESKKQNKINKKLIKKPKNNK